MFAPLARNIGQVLDGYPAEDRQRLADFLADIITATSAACVEVAGSDGTRGGDGPPDGELRRGTPASTNSATFRHGSYVPAGAPSSLPL